jgi:hypothetical protein
MLRAFSQEPHQFLHFIADLVVRAHGPANVLLQRCLKATFDRDGHVGGPLLVLNPVLSPQFRQRGRARVTQDRLHYSLLEDLPVSFQAVPQAGGFHLPEDFVQQTGQPGIVIRFLRIKRARALGNGGRVDRVDRDKPPWGNPLLRRQAAMAWWTGWTWSF